MDLQQARRAIDAVDRELVPLLEKRMEISAAIAQYKQQHDLPILDQSREQEKIAEVEALSREETAPLIGELYRKIMELSRKYQKQIMEKESGQ